MKEQVERFRLARVGLIVDEDGGPFGLEQIRPLEVTGCFSFSAACLGRTIAGRTVEPLSLERPPPPCDGWIVSACNPWAPSSLAQILLDAGRAREAIVRHAVHPSTTTFWSYIDFFAGPGQRTVVHIPNYLEACYRLAIPLDIRYTLRDDRGAVCATGQAIIPRDGAAVLSSDDLVPGGSGGGGGSSIAGYLEVELELAHALTPFLHHTADYLSEHAIASNHQSGLGLHPAGARFTRGWVPNEPGERMEVCLFQRNYDDAPAIDLVLRWRDEGGEPRTARRRLPPLEKRHMVFHDVKAAFPDVDFARARAPLVEVVAPVPLHRPNYYYSREGVPGRHDVCHAGPDLLLGLDARAGEEPRVPPELVATVRRHGCQAMELGHVVLPEESGIESFLGLVNDTTVEVSRFRLELRDRDGRLAGSFDEEIGAAGASRFVDVNGYLRAHGIAGFSGSVALRAAPDSPVPLIWNGIAGFRHARSGSPYLTTTAASGGNPDNMPFHFLRSPPNHLGCRASWAETRIFARGTSNEEFDTTFAVLYRSGDDALRKRIEYEVQVANALGRKRVVYRSIAAHGADFFTLSELVRETGLASPGGHYTVFVTTGEASLWGLHILERRRDHAIAVEHFYPGRFGKWLLR